MNFFRKCLLYFFILSFSGGSRLIRAQAPLMGVMSGPGLTRLGCPEFGTCQIRMALPQLEGPELMFEMVYPPVHERVWKKNWLYPCRIQLESRDGIKQALLQKGECQILFSDALRWVAAQPGGTTEGIKNIDDTNGKNLKNSSSQASLRGESKSDARRGAATISVVVLYPDPSWEHAKWQPLLRRELFQRVDPNKMDSCSEVSSSPQEIFPVWFLNAARHVGISFRCKVKTGINSKNELQFESSPGDPSGNF